MKTDPIKVAMVLINEPVSWEKDSNFYDGFSGIENDGDSRFFIIFFYRPFLPNFITQRAIFSDVADGTGNNGIVILVEIYI